MAVGRVFSGQVDVRAGLCGAVSMVTAADAGPAWRCAACHQLCGAVAAAPALPSFHTAAEKGKEEEEGFLCLCSYLVCLAAVSKQSFLVQCVN